MVSKTIVDNSGPAPLTIHRDGNLVVLQCHLIIMRFGESSTAWLLDALKSISSEKQKIVSGNDTLVEVFCDSGYHYIIGRKSRFVMRAEAFKKLIHWLESDENEKK